jgi:hypothetical protein
MCVISGLYSLYVKYTGQEKKKIEPSVLQFLAVILVTKVSDLLKKTLMSIP